MGNAPSKGRNAAGESLETFFQKEPPRSKIASKILGAQRADSPRSPRFELSDSKYSGSDIERDDTKSVRSKRGYFDVSGLLEGVKVDSVSENALAATVPGESAQKVGESILVKRDIPQVLDSILNTPVQSSGSSSMSPLKSIDLDDMISRLLNAGHSTKVTKGVCLNNAEIRAVCSASRELLLSQPALVDLSPPVKIVGDIHGQYTDLIRLFDMAGFPPTSNYLFLGGYVNRGTQSLETILLLLCYKLKYPENFFLLRGNHECANVSRVFGFYDECKRRCNVKIWKTFIDTFNCLPIAAIVAEKVFCVHSGLSPRLSNMDDIRGIARPTNIPDYGLLNDLLWSDPAYIEEDWKPKDRDVSCLFGKKAIMEFLQRHDFDLICRAHMVVEDGYEFYEDRLLVTVFSAPNYCGEYDNWGAVMSISIDLTCSFELLQPLDSTTLQNRLRKAPNTRLSDMIPFDENKKSDKGPYKIESTSKESIDKEGKFDQMPTAGASDTKAWLPEPPEIPSPGLSSNLYNAILSLLLTVAQRKAHTTYSRRLRSELERLFLWGEAFSLPDDEFDEVLSKSSDLYQTVLCTLYELGKVIKENLLQAVDRTSQSKEPIGPAETVLANLAHSDTAQHLQGLLEKAAPIGGAPKTLAEIESLSDCESLRYDLDEILDDVAIYIDCLMDLSLALESPVVDIEPDTTQ
ncbi:hypothetical protein N7462_008710 [Penicillium macrosclerotiorum]|uniref:uncharacterized protein n=1 Tax=Penicillium macrosclerotiorum TaxID=303699 RepID=UPI0025482415|nr:uncharacterized protein N7462_008710 [Penicillium macrosclerotiorum]KAJ5675813.1 hypothetical protein N7462_008710 [Penicillium macrosclerotiorum]